MMSEATAQQAENIKILLRHKKHWPVTNLQSKEGMALKGQYIPGDF